MNRLFITIYGVIGGSLAAYFSRAFYNKDIFELQLIAVMNSSICIKIWSAAKAFDFVSHDIILHNLQHQFYIDGILLNFTTNYLKRVKE